MTVYADEFEEQYFEKGLPGGGGYPQGYDFPQHEVETHINVLMRLLNPRSVLEVGCAYGFIVRALNERGVFAVGLDISRFCGERCVIPGRYVRGSVTHLPFRDKSFDAILSIGTLEHIPDEMAGRTIAELERVSIKGALLEISFDRGVDPTHEAIHPFEWWINQLPTNFYLFKRTTNNFTVDDCFPGRWWRGD